MYTLQILEAVGRKVNLAASVDLAPIAQETEGFSGADLQALLYNAHLEAIHETLGAQSEPGKSRTRISRVEEVSDDIRLIKVFGPEEDSRTKVSSQAEKDAIQREVRTFLTFALRCRNNFRYSSAECWLGRSARWVRQKHRNPRTSRRLR